MINQNFERKIWKLILAALKWPKKAAMLHRFFFFLLHAQRIRVKMAGDVIFCRSLHYEGKKFYKLIIIMQLSANEIFGETIVWCSLTLDLDLLSAGVRLRSFLSLLWFFFVLLKISIFATYTDTTTNKCRAEKKSTNEKGMKKLNCRRSMWCIWDMVNAFHSFYVKCTSWKNSTFFGTKIHVWTMDAEQI